MEIDEIIKLLFFAAVIGFSLVAKAMEAGKKKTLRQERQIERRERTENAPSGSGKSLAEWIEEVKRNAEPSDSTPAQPQPQPQPVSFDDFEDQAEPEPVRPHEVPKAQGHTPKETIKSPHETKHVFQEAIRSRTAPEPESDEGRRRRRHDHQRQERQGVRIAPRYEGEHAEQLVEKETIKSRAPRAKRARRSSSEDQKARTAIGMLDISGDGLRKALVLRELLGPPLSLREPKPRKP